MTRYPNLRLARVWLAALSGAAVLAVAIGVVRAGL